MIERPTEFWSLPTHDVIERLGSGTDGLTTDEASRRLKLYGSNALKPRKETATLSLLLSQFKSPLISILLLAALLSFFLQETVDALIIVAIILLSGFLGFLQEKRAADAVEKLLAIVQIKAQVMRDGSPVEIPIEEVIPGDVCILNAGDVIPADSLILESKDLFVDEAALTGEVFPSEKKAGVLTPDTPLGRRTNTLFMGTHVTSGSARAIAVFTGKETEFGKLSERIRLTPPETEFQRGIRHFGYLLTEVTFALVLIIFGVSVFIARPVLDSFLFALALAVGLIPELLPAVISINLSLGAVRMARRKVIVKQLASIENFGSMNILCSDKTGTLTEGRVRLDKALDAYYGNQSEKALFYAYINAFYETGYTNPIDEAIRADHQFDLAKFQKLDEVPYDFIRKRLSILVAQNGKYLMITKGALENVLDICSRVETSDQRVEEMCEMRSEIKRRFEEFSSQGFRVLGIAYKDAAAPHITKEDEKEMVFLGLLVFFDPPKAGIAQTITDLKALGVSLKIITGDNSLIAATVSTKVGLAHSRILTGPELRNLSEEALRKRAVEVEVFAEVEPSQKERIILALKKSGNVVGYLGDGINDASALHSADVGISVNSAVDVAKEAATIVLLEKDLEVLIEGVREGRKTFANTLKYIFMTTSANFGNMFSMAAAALFLPFLPLLPKQILLNNLLTDIPAMAIATDNVDPEMVERPRRWDIKIVRNFMVVFGIVSSAFDFLTFAALLFMLKATPDQFRTGWFLESVVTELMIVPVIRTQRGLLGSRPGWALTSATLAIFILAFLLPYSLLSVPLGFTPLPLSFVLVFLAITGLYVIASEATKRFFYKVVESR
ncbi:MAG TPA: magnesium-translocating P-type ATPase [Blastocatellia bacterium]|nr:magnesium-translocating P-type ATPase [Blastocatellia bacterium]